MSNELVAKAELPLSDALSRVSEDTLSELLSRDPEGYTEQDVSRVIEVYRAHRIRLNAAEATGKSKTKVAMSTPSEIVSLKDIDL